MKAAVLKGHDQIEYTDFDNPVCGDNDVIINVKACGICGSDVPRVLGDAAHFFPIILGHEFSGVISEAGRNAKDLRVGDRCTAAPLVPCMECPDCKAGHFSLCKKYIFIGSRVNGAMAEYVKVPAKNVVKIADDVDFIKGATFEPSSVALHALKLVDFKPGSTAAVVGCGMIGNLVLEWCRIYGGKDVTAVGRSESGLAGAKALNIEHILSTKDEDFKAKADDITNGRGFDYVFDCAGTTDGMKTAMDIAGNRGTVCYVSTPKKEITFSVPEWERINRKELTVTGTWMSYSNPFPGDEWTETAEHYAKGDLVLVPEMLHKTFPLEDVRKAFDEYKTPGNVKGRIILTV